MYTPGCQLDCNFNHSEAHGQKFAQKLSSAPWATGGMSEDEITFWLTTGIYRNIAAHTQEKKTTK